MRYQAVRRGYLCHRHNHVCFEVYFLACLVHWTTPPREIAYRSVVIHLGPGHSSPADLCPSASLLTYGLEVPGYFQLLCWLLCSPAHLVTSRRSPLRLRFFPSLPTVPSLPLHLHHSPTRPPTDQPIGNADRSVPLLNSFCKYCPRGRRSIPHASASASARPPASNAAPLCWGLPSASRAACTRSPDRPRPTRPLPPRRRKILRRTTFDCQRLEKITPLLRRQPLHPSSHHH